MAKISQYTEVAGDLSGEEEAIVANGGQNYRFKLKKIKKLITKADVGLDQVDNTPDAQKPISQLTQQALDGKAAATHGHQIDQVEGLTQALASKAAASHDHQISQVEGLTQALSEKAPASHNHGIDQVTGLTDALAAKSPTGHQHSINDVSQLPETINAIAQSLNQKAASIHSHNPGEISGLDAHIQQVVNDMGGAGGGDVVVPVVEW